MSSHIDHIAESPITWKTGEYVFPCENSGHCYPKGYNGPRRTLHGKRYAYNAVSNTYKWIDCCAGCHKPLNIHVAFVLNKFLGNPPPTIEITDDLLSALEGF